MSAGSSVAGVDAEPFPPFAAAGRQGYLEKTALHLASKRAFDLATLILAIPLVLPLFAVVAALIKLDSPGSVFYRQTRVGFRRTPFRIWKFRKMRSDLPLQGPMLTMRDDHRLTRIGRFLERTKLDELPQLINVLVGEMSIVGPRPDVPRFVELYPEKWDEVLSVKPGIFGESQNHFRNESELYPARAADVEAFYVAHILPEMLELDAAYARQATLLRDLWLLVGGVLTSVFGTVTRRTLSAVAVHGTLFIALTGLAVVAMVGAHALRGVAPSATSLALAAAVGGVSLVVFRVPRTHVTSLTADDVRRLLYCAASTTAAVAGISWAVDDSAPDAAIVVVFGLTLLATLFCFRTLSYLLHVWIAGVGSLARRLFCGAIALAPVSVAVVAISLHGLDAWRADDGAYLVMAGVLLVMRPSLLLLARPPEPRRNGNAWLRHETLHIVLSVAVGSGLAVAAVDLAVDARAGSLEVALDAVTFTILLLAFGVWQNRALPQPHLARQPSETRLLVVGAGAELSAYLAALARVRGWPIVGVVTPDRRLRRRYVSGHQVLGDVDDLPAILDSVDVDRVVVLTGSIDEPARTSVETAAAAATVDIFSVRFLPESGEGEGDVRLVPSEAVGARH